MTDRVASRLTGPVTRYKPRPDHVRRDAGDGEANVVDDVNPLGAVQLPGGGQAIVFGIDLTSTGGYARIGTVISEDIAVLAQLRPGQDVRFVEVDADEGIAVFEDREKLLQALLS
jgi:allophanate hydrolase subunit 2